MFNIYTCNAGDLLPISDVGHATVEKIIALRDQVFRLERPVITVEDLGAIRLGPAKWQELIDNGTLSIDFESVKPKFQQGMGLEHSYAGYQTLHSQDGYIIEEGPVDMLHSVDQGNTDYTAKNLAGDQTLQSYFTMLSKSQVDTNNAIRTLTEETKRIKDSQDKSRIDIASLHEGQKTLLSSVDSKLNTAESHFRQNVSQFGNQVITHVNQFTNAANAKMTDLNSNLSYMHHSFNENKQVTADSLDTIMSRIDGFNSELIKLSSNLSNTQGDIALLRSSIPPPSFQPSTPTHNAPLDDPAIINMSGFQIPPITPVPNFQYPQSPFPIPQTKVEFRPEATQNQATHGVPSGSGNSGPLPVQQAKSEILPQEATQTKNTERVSTGENKGAIEELAGVLKQLLTKAAKGDDQETEIKRIIEVIPSSNKYEAKSEDKKSDQTNDKERGRKKHKNDHVSHDSDSDRSLSPLPPKLPVFSGEPKSTSWQSFIAKFDRIASRKKWSKDKKLYRLFDCLSEKALEYAERAEEKNDYEKLKKELSLRFNIKDAPVADRSNLACIKQTEDESLEEFLHRVLTIAMNGFDKADNATMQKVALEAFLRGCRYKEAAALALNQCPSSIQEACRSVKTIMANKKAIFGSKVSFQERHFTAQEEERFSNLEQKVHIIDRNLRRVSPSPIRRDSPYPSPQRYPNDSNWSYRSPTRDNDGNRGRPRTRDYNRGFQGRRDGNYRYSPSGNRNVQPRYQSPS